MKKILPILILFLFSVGLAAAWDGSHAGTAADPHRVDACTDFDDILTSPYDGTDYYVLTTNLNCGATKHYVRGTFRGVFDGQGHYVSNLSIDCRNDPGFPTVCGFFLYSHDSTIKNLGIRDSSFRGSFFAGAFIGQRPSGTLPVIQNCYSISNTIRASPDAGGFIGTGSASISNSYSFSNTILNNRVSGFGGDIHLSDSYSALLNLQGSTEAGLSHLSSGSTKIIRDSYSDVTNGAIAPTIGTQTLSCYADANCGGTDFNITTKELSELSSDGWDESIWCKGTTGYPLLLYGGVEMEGQDDVCESQGPGGNGDEVIPEFSNTGKIVVTVIALIVVAIVASMLMKKKEPEQKE